VADGYQAAASREAFLRTGRCAEPAPAPVRPRAASSRPRTWRA
jgi:hypothetical protein